MNKLLFLLSFALILNACGNKEAETESTDDPHQMTQQAPAPAKQDITDETLIEIDPQIQLFVDKVGEIKAKYDENQNDESKAALVKAYIAFGDYMTYESPVSPRKGKYRRALTEYRHALALDPGNEKVQSEIQQIEEIYRSMGRPIPSDA